MSGVHVHAMDRAFERYGLNLMSPGIADIAERIGRGESALSERMTDGKEIRFITVQGVLVRLVWHPVHRAVVTFLPRRKLRGRRC